MACDDKDTQRTYDIYRNGVLFDRIEGTSGDIQEMLLSLSVVNPGNTWDAGVHAEERP